MMVSHQAESWDKAQMTINNYNWRHAVGYYRLHRCITWEFRGEWRRSCFGPLPPLTFALRELISTFLLFPTSIPSVRISMLCVST